MNINILFSCNIYNLRLSFLYIHRQEDINLFKFLLSPLAKKEESDINLQSLLKQKTGCSYDILFDKDMSLLDIKNRANCMISFVTGLQQMNGSLYVMSNIEGELHLDINKETNFLTITKKPSKL